MQQLRLNHITAPLLSPQQLQMIKLLQVPSAGMKERIEHELADNPALLAEEADDETATVPLSAETQFQDNTPLIGAMSRHNPRNQQAIELNLSTSQSLEEWLLEQLRFLQLDKRQYQIARYLIGSVEDDGYIRRAMEAIVNDLGYTHYIATTVKEVTDILKRIQQLDPAGIGARNLQECLTIQLTRKHEDTPAKALAMQVVTECFEEFTKKHYEKITKKLHVEQSELKDALNVISKLNPKPGGASPGEKSNITLYPDFIVTHQDGQLQVSLRTYHLPQLRVRRSYTAMLEAYRDAKKLDKSQRAAATFIKNKINNAQCFIEALTQRQHTLLNAMKAIVALQQDFFVDEDEKKLKPMLLKHVAMKIKMDISTVSRIVSNKSVQTDFGIYPLKFFFTEGIVTASGEEVSSRAVKQAIQEIIAQEDKKKPYSDEKITAMLQEKGNKVARRTVTKYREQLHLPVARLRKEL